MNTEKTAVSVVDDYLNALLVDTQVTSQSTSVEEPALRFARVSRGCELVAFWDDGSLNVSQQLYRDLMLLSLCRSVPGERLKRAMLSSMTLIGP